jgi:hypothetical protein
LIQKSVTMDHLILTELKAEDGKRVSQAFAEQGWNKPVSQYETYLLYQEQGKRDMIVAWLKGPICRLFNDQVAIRILSLS